VNVNINRRVIWCRQEHAASRGFLATARLPCIIMQN